MCELSDKTYKEYGRKLTAWYREVKRDLPWRRDKNPYHVWVSEIMLQQTRVEAVKGYYERFIAKLPDVYSLAQCPEKELMKLWEGLGYYSRVRNMQTAAQTIVYELGGVFPGTFDEIVKLKGIGAYTAGAIASIAFCEAVPAVDGNGLRVLSRIFLDDTDIKSSGAKKHFDAFARLLLDESCPGDFTQGLIELGATVCVPNALPKCETCPLAQICLAHKEGRETEFPVKKADKPRKILDYTVLIIRDDDTYALHKRPDKGLLAGLYEPVMAEGHLSQEEVLGLFEGNMPIHIERIEDSKHIFSHLEWHMWAYRIRMDELRGLTGGNTELSESDAKEEETIGKLPKVTFIPSEQISEEYAVPSAFAAYKKYFCK